MSTSTYTLTGFEQVAVDALVEHPDAGVPMDEADYAALERAIRETGAIRHPLLVLETPLPDGRRQVIDGCHRLKIALELAYKTVPCAIARDDDPLATVISSVVDGRKRTTGQRVLFYLERRWGAVWAFQEESMEILKAGGRLSANRADHAEHSPGAIAELLKCSEKDVRAGIELLACLREGLGPRRLGTRMEQTEAHREALERIRGRVVAGSMRIRTWLPAFWGEVTTRSTPPEFADHRAPHRTLTTLGTVWERWHTLNPLVQAEAKKVYMRTLLLLPDALVGLTLEMLQERAGKRNGRT